MNLTSILVIIGVLLIALTDHNTTGWWVLGFGIGLTVMAWAFMLLVLGLAKENNTYIYRTTYGRKRPRK